MLINEKPSFQVAWPLAAIQFERGQEGAPLFGCQVASGQAHGGAAQSAPNNWNVDWSAGTDPLTDDIQICVLGHSHAI